MLIPAEPSHGIACCRDHRSPGTPLHLHSSLHSDDITSLSFLPSSLHHLTFPVPPASPGGTSDGPAAPSHSSAILLSGSTDGLMAITNALEADEDEAQLSVGNGGVSVAKAGWVGQGGWDVWGRDDMDGAGRWDGEDVSTPSLLAPFGDRTLTIFPRCPLQFTQKSHIDSLRLSTEESVTGPPAWSTDYLIDMLPTIPSSSPTGLPTSLVGDNTSVPILLFLHPHMLPVSDLDFSYRTVGTFRSSLLPRRSRPRRCTSRPCFAVGSRDTAMSSGPPTTTLS